MATQRLRSGQTYFVSQLPVFRGRANSGPSLETFANSPGRMLRGRHSASDLNSVFLDSATANRNDTASTEAAAARAAPDTTDVAGITPADPQPDTQPGTELVGRKVPELPGERVAPTTGRPTATGGVVDNTGAPQEPPVVNSGGPSEVPHRAARDAEPGNTYQGTGWWQEVPRRRRRGTDSSSSISTPSHQARRHFNRYSVLNVEQAHRMEKEPETAKQPIVKSDEDSTSASDVPSKRRIPAKAKAKGRAHSSGQDSRRVEFTPDVKRMDSTTREDTEGARLRAGLQAKLGFYEKMAKRSKSKASEHRASSGLPGGPTMRDGLPRGGSVSPDPLRPSVQLNSSSYLGRAFARAFRDEEGAPGGDPDSSGSSDSDSTSIGDSPRGSDTSSVRKLRKRVRTMAEWHLKRRKEKRTLIKPIPPDVYDGSPDNRKFHRFVMQATTYLQDGRVPKHRRAYVLMSFLSGKAYEFYVKKVAYTPELWTMREFFSGLFDYCFPVNYHLEQRRKFKFCHQGTWSV
jgi:hypothetical protein